MSRERKGSIVERDKKVYARVQFIGIDVRKSDIWRKADNRKHARERNWFQLKKRRKKVTKKVKMRLLNYLKRKSKLQSLRKKFNGS